MKISKFLDEDLVNYASYDNLRKVSSYVDGLKNTSRKILHTVLEKNITTETKVSQLASKVAEFTEYLHGDCSGVIVSMAQNYPGTNNLPLLAREGQFGTRFKNEAAASRYIYTQKEKYLDKIFNKEDNKVLIQQEFEGTMIEPRFFVPNLPLLLINGSMNCITPGFRQHILPRNKDELVEYIKLKITGKDVSHLKLEPYFVNFKGSIKTGESIGKWCIEGKFVRLSATNLRVTELPVTFDLVGYKKVLQSLVDAKTINSFKDKSEGDDFNFEISAPLAFTKLSDEKILDKLKLIKKESEQYNCIDEFNRMRLFEGIHDILDAYIRIKLEYTNKRKNYYLDKLKDKMSEEASKYIFIKSINDGQIIITNKTKQEISEQIQAIPRITPRNGSYDYLISIPLYRITLDELDKAKDNIMKLKEEYKLISEKTPEDIWVQEL